MDRPDEPATLRRRLVDDVAAGRTVVLTATDMSSPEVRASLPAMLESIAGTVPAGSPLRLPGYEVLGAIGRGGMSSVYLARHVALGRHVALKVAPRWLDGDGRAKRRLADEARAMARVAHANIVAIHDVVEHGDTLAIAMEWVDGLTLTGLMHALPPQADATDLERMRRALGDAHAFAGEKEPRRCLVRMLRDVARAVQRVHDAGLLHLDVKPSNVLVRRDGTPLLADFGVVREAALDAGATRSFAGTPAYAAPEQMRRDDRAIGARTDVYGLGLTLYEALARRQPLRDLDFAAILEIVERGGMPRLEQLALVPRELADVVHKAIAPEPALRYAGAGAFADDLDAWLAGRPVTARPQTTSQRTWRWVRREPAQAALAASLALLLPALFALGGYLLSELPNIEAQRLTRRRADADTLKQRAYQDLLTVVAPKEVVSDRLVRAMALDPTPSSLVCLLAMQHDQQEPGLAATMQANAATMQAHLGLRLFAAKVAAGRSFFDADEQAQLAASRDPLDAYVLALDRLFFADDQATEESHRAAVDRIVAASTAIGDDPLLDGLQLWSLAGADMDSQLRSMAAALRARRAGDRTTQYWALLGLEWVDIAAAAVDAWEATRATPQDPWGWEQLVGLGLRNDAKSLPAPTELLAQARAAGASSSLLRTYELVNGAIDAASAAKALREIPAEHDLLGRRLRLQRMADPALARAECERVLTAEHPRCSELAAVHFHCFETKDVELASRTFARGAELFPDRRRMHVNQLALLVHKRDVAGAKLVLRDAPIGDRMVKTNGALVASLLVEDRAWRRLFDFCERWLRLCDREMVPQASSYAGIAASRLGDPMAAAARFAVALAAEPKTGKWYAHALQEDAWLRAAPDSPAELRDPSLAEARLQRFDAYAPRLRFPFGGPWTSLVRAEVALANGDLGAARAAAEMAKSQRNVEPWAPDQMPAWIDRAVARSATK